MTYLTEELVRRIVGHFLRSDNRAQFFCSSGLVKLARESLDTTYPRSEIERAMNTVFQSPRCSLRRLQVNDAVPRGAESVTPPHPPAD